MAHPDHEKVRQRFHQCCGYCGVSETETGGELTIDHFRPVSAAGDDSEDNLVYCCFRCNTSKSDFFPNADDVAHAHRILHPLLDSISSHFRENEQTGCLEPLSDTGRFHLTLLRLNRPQLIQHRLARRLRHLLLESCQLLQRDNEDLRVRVVLLETYLAELLRNREEDAEQNEHE